ncbi:MAG: tubulin-like doman-containing protein [candidate division Zixibacteria bacterium]|nr:tubulin-like doman-containing protein [candidate division Zixibacteria bacterium]
MRGYDSTSKHRDNPGSAALNEQQLNVRPTFYVGLGGIGCAVLRRLKTRIRQIAPEAESAFAFLGADTQAHEVSDILTANEYVALSLGVKPDAVAKMEPDTLDWYRRLVKGWRAKSITFGANQVKAVGRLALRYPPTFQEFVAKMAKANNQLGRAKDALGHGASVKVYIISSLMGGTGSGSLVDIMAVVGRYFEREAGPDFPYQAILLTPDVLLNEISDGQLEVLKSNTYATLKELHHTISGQELTVDYDDKIFRGTKIASDALPRVIHLIGDKNEDGFIVAGLIEELGDIVVSYLASEIQTPMKDLFSNVQIQDKENSDFDEPGRDDAFRAFSSFGVVRTGFPKEIIEQLFALQAAHATLDAELASSSGTFDRVANWIESHNLKENGADQLQDQIRQEHKKISIDAKGNIMAAGFKYEKLLAEAKAYQKKMTDSLEADKKKTVSKQVDDIAKAIVVDAQKTFEDVLKQENLTDAMQFAGVLLESLKDHQKALREEAEVARGFLAKASDEVKSSIGIIDQSIKGYFGRRRRVEDAVNDFDARLENMLNRQVNVWIMDEADKVYIKLQEKCDRLIKEWKDSVDMLKGHRAGMETNITSLRNFLDRLADIEKRGPENRFSLVNSIRANELYQEIVGPELEGIIGRTRNLIVDKGMLKRVKQTFEDWSSNLEEQLVTNEMNSRLEPIDFAYVLDRFYPKEDQKKVLFDNLSSLSTPLFRLDGNLKQSDYEAYWIVGVHPSLQERFHNEYERFLGAQRGRVYAGFDSAHEIIIYQLKHGYTIHSFLPLRDYQSHYTIRLNDYRRGIEKKEPKRPVHGWVEATEWADLIPNREAEEGLKWFILGRAFNHLFPAQGASSPTDRKNTSYLYARGACYFMQTSEGQKPEEVGRGLADAVRNFSERTNLLQTMQTMIRSKIAEAGEQVIREGLEQEYVPILKNEIEIATNNPKSGDSARADILRKLFGALRQFIDEDLRSPGRV